MKELKFSLTMAVVLVFGFWQACGRQASQGLLAVLVGKGRAVVDSAPPPGRMDKTLGRGGGSAGVPPPRGSRRQSRGPKGDPRGPAAKVFFRRP